MSSLPPYPDICSCHTVECKFQDPNFLIDKVSCLIEDNKEKNFDASNLKKVQSKLKEILASKLETPP